jgi:nitroreductase
MRRYAEAVDAFLAIAGKREVRRYADGPLPAELQRRILDAGRVSGSSANRQQSRFVAITDRDRLALLAETVYAPDNVRGAQLAMAIAVHGKGPTSFDAGRAAQNMMLAASNEGVGSCPNGMPDRAATAEVLGLREGEDPAIVLSFAIRSGRGATRSRSRRRPGWRRPIAGRSRRSWSASSNSPRPTSRGRSGMAGDTDEDRRRGAAVGRGLRPGQRRGRRSAMPSLNPRGSTFMEWHLGRG